MCALTSADGGGGGDGAFARAGARTGCGRHCTFERLAMVLFCSLSMTTMRSRSRRVDVLTVMIVFRTFQRHIGRGERLPVKD